jgi:hypothetical protein
MQPERLMKRTRIEIVRTKMVIFISSLTQVSNSSSLLFKFFPVNKEVWGGYVMLQKASSPEVHNPMEEDVPAIVTGKNGPELSCYPFSSPYGSR